MTKVLTAEMQHKHAERQLFAARRALSHLVELYESGQWRHLYKEEAFAEAVRQARQAVDAWADAVAKAEAQAKAKANVIEPDLRRPSLRRGRLALLVPIQDHNR